MHAYGLLVCVLCQPVNSCIEPSLHEVDLFLEIFYEDHYTTTTCTNTTTILYYYHHNYTAWTSKGSPDEAKLKALGDAMSKAIRLVSELVQIITGMQ